MKIENKKPIISAVIIIALLLILFNAEKITGQSVKVEKARISLSNNEQKWVESPGSEDVIVSAGSYIYVKVTPAKNNKRVFIYDSRGSSKAGTFQTSCSEFKGSNCVVSGAKYKIPTDSWADGVYTIKIAGVEGKAEFTLKNSKFGG